MDNAEQHIAEAAELGRSHAIGAASWCIDGNTSQDHYARLARMFDKGDPELYDYLPREPNLSGEFADDPTPQSLYQDITVDHYGDAYEDAGLAGETLVGSVLDAMCAAYEDAVSDTFAPECERLIRAALER